MSELENISPEDIPLLAEGVDLKTLKISPEEGFLLSQVDGQIRIRHLVMMSGLSEEQTLSLIKSLIDKGAIIIHGARGKTKARKEKEEAETDEALAPGSAAATAAVRIVIDPKKIPTGQDFEDFVDRLIKVMDRTDYFHLLQVPKDATAVDIKKAYRRLSKIFHPDQYFRKVTPRFRRKLQQVFKQINIAYQVLADDERRREYISQMGERGVEGAVEELRLEVSKKVFTGPKLKLGLTQDKEKLKQEKLKQMFAAVKNTPLEKHLEKVERLYHLALDEARKKNFKSAKINLKLAIQLDPTGGKKYKDELERIEKQEQEVQAENSYREGLAAEQNGEYQRASKCYSEAARLSPHNSQYVFSLAQTMIKYQNNFEKGRTLLIKLSETYAKNPDYFYLLGLAYKGLGQNQVARVQFQKALELNPKHNPAQKELKSLG